MTRTRRKKKARAESPASRGDAGGAQSPPPRTRRRAVILAGFAVAGTAYLAWFAASSRSPEKPSPPSASSASNPNVLLITLDTTRADRLGCYGYEAAQTPTIDALARSGVRFEKAYCQVPITLPSHTSLLTGLHPPSTGVRINGVTGLGDDVPTMAELFKRHGYRTGAFIGAAVLDAAFGLDKGFDLYDADMGSDKDGRVSHKERPADRVCDSALNWLNQGSGSAFFAWVHLFDPHTPYDPPREFADRFDDPYDGEIAFADTQVKRLVDWLDAKGLRDNTLIIVLGDHGEGLGDHKEAQHGCFIYNSTMHVPLIFSFPSQFDTPRSISADVRLVDVFPTVVGLLGWKLPADLQGQSLAKACLTGNAPRLPIYGESEYPLLGFGWSPLHSLIVTDWKYIDAPKPELFDRSADPAELINVIDDHLDVAKRMQEDLAGLMSQMTKRVASSVALDEKALDQLAGLGYVAGAAASIDINDGTARKDPKDMIEVYTGFERATGMLRAHNHEGIIRLLEPLVKRSPESDVVHGLLAMAYLNAQRYSEAQRAFEASLRTTPRQPGRLCGLAEAFRKQGKFQDAIGAFQRALEASPNWTAAHSGLGALYSRMKRYAQAEPHWRHCVELDPTSVNALTNLGTVLLAQRRPAEAIPLLQNALGYDPANEFAHRSLWQALAGVGQRSGAIQALRNARKALPGAASLACPLARLLATTPRMPPLAIDEAIQLARQCCETGVTNAMNLDTLAAAYAAKGDFSQAIETVRKAISAASDKGQVDLQRQIEGRLRLYESGRPYVEMPRRSP